MFVYLGNYREKSWWHRAFGIPYKDGRTAIVHTHRYDAWNADDQLATVILPVLQMLRKDGHGAANVDSKDVPEELRMTAADRRKYNKTFITDANWNARWEYVLDEMIWAFTQKTLDWEVLYWNGDCEDADWVNQGDGGQAVSLKNVESCWDLKGRDEHAARMGNGFRLFGKYYECLWD